MDNSTVYQTQSTGKTFKVLDNATTCLALACFFKSDTIIHSTGSRSIKEAYVWIDSFLHNKNGMYAIRIRGSFDYVKTRAFPPVTSRPYPDITSLMSSQHFFERHKVNGMFVGFKLPAYMDGITIPGFHLHFISEEKNAGGHVTEFTWDKVVIEIEELHQLQVDVPQSEEFKEFKFQKNRLEDLKRLENGGVGKVVK